MSAVMTAEPIRLVTSVSASLPRLSGAPVELRQGTPSDAPAIHALILDHLKEGHLLPRRLEEISAHAGRFIVAVDSAGHGGRVVACAELAPLSRTLAEVRSLVVGNEARGLGVGSRIVDELARRGAVAGFVRLCAFAHSPGYFLRMGFSIVPHEWLAEKIATDCHACPEFRHCGQFAVIRPLARQRDACVPLAALHG